MQDDRPFVGPYAALNDFVAPIRPALWRLFVGLLVITVVFLIGFVAFFAVVAYFSFRYRFDAPNLGDSAGESPLEMLVFLGGFIVLWGAVAVAAAWPGGRSVGSLMGPWRAAYRDFGRVLGAMVPLLALVFVMTIYLDPNVVRHMSLGALLPWLPLGLLVLFIQTSAEEAVFRGFIMGQLAARFRHPLVWMLLPAALFGALHWDAASYGGMAWIVCAATALFALTASDLVARSGNLGAAIAMHFGNNFFAMVLVGESGRMDGLSLFTAPIDLTDPMTVALQFVLTIVMWLVARLALRH